MTAELQRVQTSQTDTGIAGATGRVDSWRVVRAIAYLAYVGLWARVLIAYGVPTDRLEIALLIAGGLAITRLGRGWSALARVFVDWLPFTLVLMAYDRTRAVADALGLPLHVGDVLHVERDLFGWIFGGQEPTVWLQQHLYDPGVVHWYDVACTLVYSSHFLVTPVLAAVLWLRRRELWLAFITRVVALSAAGLATYCLFPQAPPWYAAREGLSEPVARLAARGWVALHLGDVRQTLESAQRDGANPVAAMPSLHTAFAVLIAITAITTLRTRWRWLALLYPLAMGFALVYTGEHYVIDLVAGAGYAVAVHVGVRRWETHRAARIATAAGGRPSSS